MNESNPSFRISDVVWARDSQHKPYNFTTHEEIHQIEENSDTVKRIPEEIEKNLNPKNGLGYELITDEIMRRLTRKVIIKIRRSN